MEELSIPRTLAQFNDPILRQKAEEVECADYMSLIDESGELYDLIEDIKKIVKTPYTIGLSAPQVGVLKQVIVLDFDKDKSDPFVIINPKIIEYTNQVYQIVNEGCLSLPQIFEYCERPKEVTLEYINREGHVKRSVFTDFEAACVLHEYDHLHGTLFIDRCLSRDRHREFKRRFKMTVPKVERDIYAIN